MPILYTVLEQAKRISAVPSSNLRGVSVPLSSLFFLLSYLYGILVYDSEPVVGVAVSARI